MIKRIVKMSFDPDRIDEFIALFNNVKSKIAAHKGCHSVELLQSVDATNEMFTLSYWDSVDDLNQYRNSELFGVTWKKTKQMFIDKPEAWSLISKGKS